MIKRFKRPILLTGTPAFAKPKELFNLLSILRPDVFSQFKEYGNRYCDPKPNKWQGGLDYEGATNLKELHFILDNSIMIRRLKKDVLGELPSKRRQKVTVKTENSTVKKIQGLLSKSSRGASLDDLIDKMIGSNENELEVAQKVLESKHPEMLQCYTLTGIAKIAGIQEYIEDFLDSDIKVLIFAHHKEVLDGIEESVRKMRIRYVRIDGQVDQKKRHASVKQFQEDEQTRVAILSLTAAGTGFNFTAASTMIFAEVSSFLNHSYI